MIHPSYFELMDLVNKDVKEGEEPVVRSRYSIVLGTAKRARQVIDARAKLEEVEKKKNPDSKVVPKREMEAKPLSIAVEELDEGKIHILRSHDEGELPEDLEVSEADEDMIFDETDEEVSVEEESFDGE